MLLNNEEDTKVEKQKAPQNKNRARGGKLLFS